MLGNLLTISAERKASREAKDVDYLYRELSYGTLSRTLTLPEGLDTEKINAEYNNGLLEIIRRRGRRVARAQVEIKGLPKASWLELLAVASRPEPQGSGLFSLPETHHHFSIRARERGC